MTQYCFLSLFLLPQIPESPPVYSFRDLDDFLRLNLSQKDFKHYVILKRFFDFNNFAFFWSGKKITQSYGMVTQENVENLLRLQQWSDDCEFEDFFKDFLLQYKTSQERLDNFSYLVGEFLAHYRNSSSEFLRTYFTFKQNLRVILAGFRSRVLQLDVSYVLRNEDSSDPIVLQVLMQKDSPHYELPREFADLSSVLEDYGHLPHTLNRTLSLYEFHKIEEMYRDKYFDADAVLAKITTYLLAIHHNVASVEKGRNIINSMERAITW
ncbi:DUF2764 family protein [Chlamydia gallinacea]|uniref:DUF2764 domain-containing protein n=2 Tax=Chlamydia gallinacea TaxID=1457153 RepID=A0A173DXW9_9CHLA|nr:DUF2764 family protein [Chlamydia gallinacea]EYE60911.1 hypothetical protein M127_5773 [Bacteroides fragilis str. S6L5]ANG65770.1 hypothetical protein M787_000290 [Chlamydia gallinacea 08-1274/3]AQT77168.1 hypothetical protein B1F83_00565 [Chlamydia gallinacea]MBX6680327.1 DUF2764 family protein [Chlamydia gallinacea]MBX6687551.1 DUF2764 family protein [Chlamydia gallinacea]